MGRIFLALLLLSVPIGCAQRTLTIHSEPSGAKVQINGVEIGRTPLRREFVHYGDYDIVLRRDGYQTLKTIMRVKPPLHQIPPLDLVAELAPGGVQDHQVFTYVLHAAGDQSPQQLAERAFHMRTLLPATQPLDPPEQQGQNAH